MRARLEGEGGGVAGFEVGIGREKSNQPYINQAN